MKSNSLKLEDDQQDDPNLKFVRYYWKMEGEDHWLGQIDPVRHQLQEPAGFPHPQPVICIYRVDIRGLDKLSGSHIRQFSHVL